MLYLINADPTSCIILRFSGRRLVEIRRKGQSTTTSVPDLAAANAQYAPLPFESVKLTCIAETVRSDTVRVVFSVPCGTNPTCL